MRRVRTSDKSTEELLKEAAIELFGKYGYEGTSVRIIAQKAGFSAGQITKSFGSKENLFNEIVMDIFMSMDKDYQPILGHYQYLKNKGDYTDEDIWELIEQIIDMQIGFVFEKSNFKRIHIINVHAINDNLRTSSRLIKTTKSKIEDTLAELFREVFKQKRRLHCMTVSRAVNGAIVSFAEHPDLLLDEVLTSKYMPSANEWMKEYLKKYLMGALRAEANRDDSSL